MVGLAVFMFVVAVVMVVLACANQREMYWTFSAWSFRDPAANEPSDAAFAVRRASLFMVAAASVGLGVWMLVLHARSTFDAGDVRAAVNRAAASLDTKSVPEFDTGTSYGLYVDGALQDRAPTGLVLRSEEVGEPGRLPARFTITASDVKGRFCLTVRDAGPAEGGGFAVPGAPGEKMTEIKERRLAADVSEGECPA